MIRKAAAMLAIAILAGHLPTMTARPSVIPVACPCPDTDALCKVQKCSGDIGSPTGAGSNATISTKRPDETIQQDTKGNAPAKPNTR